LRGCYSEEPLAKSDSFGTVRFMEPSVISSVGKGKVDDDKFLDHSPLLALTIALYLLNC